MIQNSFKYRDKNMYYYQFETQEAIELSIELLQEAVLFFEHHRVIGVDTTRFRELLMSSRAVMRDPVKEVQTRWVVFHKAWTLRC